MSEPGGSVVVDGVLPGSEDLEELRTWCRGGRLMDVWKKVQGLAPLKDWPGGEGREMASRVAVGLGADRLSDVLDLLNWRTHPEYHEAFYRAQVVYLQRGRSLEVQDALRDRLERKGLTDVQRAEILALDGWIDGFHGDYPVAYGKLDEALSLNPNDAWLPVEKGSILEREDRYEEALEVGRQAMAMEPGYRPPVSLVVRVLVNLHRDEEAEQLLLESHESTDHHYYTGRLQSVFSERGDHERGLWCLDEYERLLPLMEKRQREWVAGRRADFHYMAGRIEESLKWCDRAGKGFHQKAAVRLREPGVMERNRKRLDVHFVRQHDMTCAPATLAAISAYWGKDIDHLAIADAICYDGTPWHKERQWAVENGFVVREFRVTADSARELIDREIPFTLTTSWVTGAHLQACIGYDDRQGTLLLRDPTNRHYGEILTEGLIKDHPVQGPRGMVLVPEDRADLLEEVFLPDAAVYDALHDFSSALEAHKRLEATAAMAVMRVVSEDHPVQLDVRNRLANYDRDAYEQVRVLEEVVERFPESEAWKFRLLGALERSSGARERRLAILSELVAKGKCDPVFYVEYGELLAQDARDSKQAKYYLMKALRKNPREARVYTALGMLLWKEGDRMESLRCRRIASCLMPAFEGYADDYFHAARWEGLREEGLAYLRMRVDQWGAKSSGPWLTLADCLDQMARDDEAREVLEEALVKMPEDGDLKLTAGRKLHSWGWRERGEELVRSAEGMVPGRQWYRELARMATYEGDRTKALEYYRAVIRLQPAEAGAQRALVTLMEEEVGRAPVMAHLERVVEKFPEDVGLLSLYAEWVGKESAEKSLPVLEKLLDLSPNSLWARREYGWKLQELGRTDDALEELGKAIEIGPQFSEGYGMKGGVYMEARRYEEAMACFEESVKRDVDYDYGVNNLMSCAERLGKVEEGLSLVRSEMARQVSDGSAISTYRSCAYQHVEPAELQEQLLAFCEERSDLWEAWTNLNEHALDVGDHETAGRACEELVTRFSALPRAWAERARWHSAGQRFEEEISDLQRALEISPAWDWAARRLAEVLERVGRYDEAVETLERAVGQEPLVAMNYRFLTELLWRLERREKAFEWLATGIDRISDYSSGWVQFAEWAQVLGREEEVLEKLKVKREAEGKKVVWWLLESDVLDTLDRDEEALQAVDEGLKINPLEQDLHDRRAYMLVYLGRFDEALEACEPEALGPEAPRELRGRKAWVLMQSGQPALAIKEMKAVVEDRPDYVWAGRQLMSWLSDREDWAALRSAAKTVVRMDPKVSYGWGFLAEAEQGLKNPKEERAALERAFVLDRTYSYAGRRLLEFQAEDKDFAEAHQTLESLEHFCPSAWITIDGVELAFAEGDTEEAQRRARLVLSDAETEVGVLSFCRSVYVKIDRGADWDALLNEEMAKDDPGAGLLDHWSAVMVEHRKVARAAKLLTRLKVPSARKAAAWANVIGDVIEQENRDNFRSLVKKHRGEFREHPQTWGKVGYGMSVLETPQKTSEWFEDWENRLDEVSPASFLNLASAMDDEGGPMTARHVREAALKAYPTNEYAGCYQITLAWCLAKEGDLEGAQRYLEVIEMDRIMPFYRGVGEFTEAMLSARAGDEARAGSRFVDGLKSMGGPSGSPAARAYAEGAAAVVAQAMPWAKGNPKKVMKRFCKVAGVSKSSGLGSVLADNSNRIWIIILILYVLFRVI